VTEQEMEEEKQTEESKTEGEAANDFNR